MTIATLSDRLSHAVTSPDPIAELECIVESLTEEDDDIVSVGTILRFMEHHPDLDVGAPGPLVHYVERFYGAGYEQELLESLKRRPTAHSVWMLNRVINGTKDATIRAEFIKALRSAASHPHADEETRNGVAAFLRGPEK